MQENYGLALRVATLLVIDFVNRRDLQPAGVEWFDGRVKQPFVWHDAYHSGCQHERRMAKQELFVV
jgi:hypothetical protein